MAARLIGFIIIGIIALACILVATYVAMRARERAQPKPELDISVRPSMWWVDEKTTTDGRHTSVGIIRVDNKTKEVLERRTMLLIANSNPEYAERLDRAHDEAYQAQRNANTGLMRR